MHTQMIRLAGTAGEFLHVRHRTIEQAVHRRVQVGKLEQPQGEQISGIGPAGQEAAAHQRASSAEFRVDKRTPGFYI